MQFAPSPALTRVARGALCSGCGGCALLSSQITMAETAEGFLRPRQTGPVGTAEEAAIAAVCPGLGQSVDAGERRDDVLWGPYHEMRQGWATDPDLRFRASSGGALSALLVHLLESGRVKGVVEVTADPDQPTGNRVVISRSADAIRAAAGSRYAPSSPLAELEPVLAGEVPMAFVGKPCDVAALRALSARDPRVAERIPVLVSFFCAGVPSRRAADRVLAALGTSPAEVTTFRYRGMGWPGRATARLADGSERSMTYHESWGGILSGDVQHRCKICADGTGKAADIVCADAWETDARGYPLFEEQDGVSLIVARTGTGTELMAAATAAGRLETQPFDPSSLAAIQPGQSGRRRALLARLAALRLIGRPVPLYRGLHLGAAARQARPRALAKNFLGTLRRGLTGRGKEKGHG